MMQRCLKLAQQAAGYTAPNPLVGSVVTQDLAIVGEGFHPKAGQPHAEVFALRAAGDSAAGATLYVNLEPCNHHGRTPPCTEAIIQAGIRRVCVGMVDPDGRVSGSGLARLRAAGLEVVVGIEEAACQQLNEAFVHRIQHHQPFGILKYAMTLDGKIATVSGHSAWVTGAEARAAVHRLRSVCDAVIVGGNTVRRDNPHLTSHGQGDRNPLRIVMSQQLDLPREANLWQVDIAQTLVLTNSGANPQMQDWLQHQGVEVIELPALSPTTAMHYLYQRELLSVLWECGGRLAAAAIAEGAVQKVWAFVAPKIIGGQNAPTPVGDLGFDTMTQALQLERLHWQQIGTDLLIEAYLL
ncbi:MAG: bifunctional diaminohydroxyphosphoribosylaminopyrimidine deaminase/5-amino-6-(5-phosphoribosylamino)uracil reductase RibD [Leptolyngbyaceae cyanobacterium RM1_1_2]|nr:bifunctional diaminohydroxyphosphoribosylaminopyrimidine deaminase/5-amino-6-(5-phosphoribosylamino)uracil reductase RibD [Leptolyngbyaceae cyanobacterium RM1_1_2]